MKRSISLVLALLVIALQESSGQVEDLKNIPETLAKIPAEIGNGVADVARKIANIGGVFGNPGGSPPAVGGPAPTVTTPPKGITAPGNAVPGSPFLYPIGSEIAAFVDPSNTKMLPQDNDEEHLHLSPDGSLPENSPLRYFFHVLETAESEIKKFLDTDGFYRNLLFAENLFDGDNDALGVNNAQVTVNVYARKKKRRQRGKERPNPVLVTHADPGKIEIRVDNDFDSSEDPPSTLDWTKFQGEGKGEGDSDFVQIN